MHCNSSDDDIASDLGISTTFGLAVATSPAMTDSTTSQAAQKANLARIRDNQRRSRARRKEYLQELEVKYRTCEAVGVEASSEIQAAARRVLEENKRLRALLKQQGLSDAEIDGFSSPSSPSPSISSAKHVENPQFPLPSSSLTTLLAAPRECKPGACGPPDDSASRRKSSADNVSSFNAPSQTPQFSPPPMLLPRQPTVQARRQHERQQQQQQPLTHLNVHTLSQPSPSQLSPQHQGRSSTSAPSTNTQYSLQPSPRIQPDDYGMYDPHGQSNPYMYSMPDQSHMAQWNLSQSAGTPPHPFMPTTESYTAHQPSTSCYVAADAIRSYAANAGPEVERVLGCNDGSECHVSNDLVFDLMDQYAAASASDERLP